VELPAKTTSFKRWAELLATHARSAKIDQEIDYCLNDRMREARRLPVDYALGKNEEKSARTITVELSEDETRLLLREAPKAYRTQVSDIVLTALGQAFANWTGDERLLIDVEGHGREGRAIEGADVSRTVGWFTSLYPVLLEVGGEEGASLRQVKEQMRRVPGAGIGYGLLKYMSDRRDAIEKIRAFPRAEVSFNYLGQFDQIISASSMLTLARESSGPAIDRSERRPYLLEATGWISSGRLSMGWTYSEDVHKGSTIEALAQEFIKSLRALIDHCLSPEAGGYTPADFSEADLSQSELDDLVAKLGDSLD
jgi:non-ribosomal peptide synthase protein (TIGR01720 family)